MHIHNIFTRQDSKIVHLAYQLCTTFFVSYCLTPSHSVSQCLIVVSSITSFAVRGHSHSFSTCILNSVSCGCVPRIREVGMKFEPKVCLITDTNKYQLVSVKKQNPLKMSGLIIVSNR